MLLQLTLQLERLVRAPRTHQAAHLTVTVHVHVQLADLREAQRTLVAHELLHLVVRLHMIVQVGHLQARKGMLDNFKHQLQTNVQYNIEHYLGKGAATVMLNAHERPFAGM